MYVIVNPANGDSYASIVDEDGNPIGKLNAGTMIQVEDASNNKYQIMPSRNDYSAVPQNDEYATCMTGVVYYGNAGALCRDASLKDPMSIINPGTSCEILDDSNTAVYQIKCMTRDGILTGYIPSAAIYRCPLDVEETEETDPIERSRMMSRGPMLKAVAKPEDVAGGKKSPAVGDTYKIINGILKNPNASPLETTRGVAVVTTAGGTTRSGWIANNVQVKVKEFTKYFKKNWIYIEEKIVSSNVIVPDKPGEKVLKGWVSEDYLAFVKSSKSYISKNDGTPSILGEDPSSGGSDGGTTSGNPASVQNTVKREQKEVYVDDPEFIQAFNEGLAQAWVGSEVYDREYYLKMSKRYGCSLGAPPHYNMDIDPQYMDTYDASGRVFRKTILQNPSLLFIMPGKVEMFPNLIGTKKENLTDLLYQTAVGHGGGSSLLSKIKKDESGKFSGKMYRFKPDLTTYSYYVNGLCRAAAILMGLGDKTFGGTKGAVPFKKFDYAGWAVRGQIPAAKYNTDPNDVSIFKDPYENVLTRMQDIFADGSNQLSLVFFMNGAETSVSESMSTNITDSPLGGVIGTINEVGATLNYFTGSGFSTEDDASTVEQALDAVMSSNSTVNDLKGIAKNFLNGGKMILPKMIEGCQYGKAISVNLKFISPFGSRYSIFTRCIVPICHILALSLPRQLSDNMFGMPQLIRANQLGCFYCDLGVITSVNITRGGPDDTAWTIEGLATEWDVQLEIQPLVDELMVSSTSHPLLFMKNDDMLNFVGNYCGFDLMSNEGWAKSQIFLNLLGTFFQDKIQNLPKWLEDKFFTIVEPMVSLAFS